MTKKINPKVNLAVIPKISIQMLVENAIIHGMPENGSCSSHYHSGMYGK